MAPARVFFEVLVDMFGADMSQEGDAVRFHMTAEVAYNQDVQFHCGGCFLAFRGEKGGLRGSERDFFARLGAHQTNGAFRRFGIGSSGEKLAALGFGRSERPRVKGLTDKLAAHAAVKPERTLAARHVGGVAGGGVPPVDGQFVGGSAFGHACTIRLTRWTGFLYCIFHIHEIKLVNMVLPTRTY
jgi:hypothetical protein